MPSIFTNFTQNKKRKLFLSYLTYINLLINGILLNIKLVIKLIINTIREIKKTFIVKFIFKLNTLYFINNPKTKP